MPGSRRLLGSPVAPRPFVEKIRNPFYDSVQVATTNLENRLFVSPIGTVDTTAVNGANKTFIDTNIQQGGSLPTPKSFDIEAISIKYPNNISQTDLNAFLNTTHVVLTVGEKSYLAVPVYVVPGEAGIEGNITTSGAAPTVTRFALHNGIGMHKNVYDLMIPEEVVDPATGRGAWTGRKVPVHLPSNQQFSVNLVHPGGITLTASQRVYVFLWGELKREVH